MIIGPQEANKLVPNAADTLCLAAKAWSDACYLDEIQSPFRERLTMQDRHEVNKKAIEYAKQVGDLHQAAAPLGARHECIPKRME